MPSCRFPIVHTVAFKTLDHRGLPTQGKGLGSLEQLRSGTMLRSTCLHSVARVRAQQQPESLMRAAGWPADCSPHKLDQVTSLRANGAAPA